MLISIIIPALNEEKYIAEVLEHTLKLKGRFEVIVVDGGSQDETLEIARGYKTVNVLQSKKGRARQMNHGAGQAKGEVLLFLHADTFLPTSFYTDVSKLMEKPEVVGGSFRLKMESSHPIFKFYHWCSQFSLEFFTYGDHALFIKTETFKKIQGFKNLSFMEDVEIQKRIREEGKFRKLKTSVTTSSRRFQKNGIFFQLAIDVVLVVLYKIGIPPNRLKRYYPNH